MSRYLLDTNVISELRKGPRCALAVANWYQKVSGSDLYLSLFTVAELRKGVALMKKKNPVFATQLEVWCDQTEAYYRGLDRLLGLDERVAAKWGELMAIRTLPILDAFLAATAQVHNLVLVTRNTTDFVGLKVQVEDPFHAGH